MMYSYKGMEVSDDFLQKVCDCLEEWSDQKDS